MFRRSTPTPDPALLMLAHRVQTIELRLDQLLRALGEEPIEVPKPEWEAVGVEAFTPEAETAPAEAPEWPESDRVRNSPFKRVPQFEQRKWLFGVLVERRALEPGSFARELAGDEREYRYLRSAIGRTLHDFHDEGIVQRGKARERGSMYRYTYIDGKTL